jgi:hypothetical protein
MKKFNSILFILFSVASLNAQKNIKSVEKSILSIQTGYFGTWINHELKFNKRLALRTELGSEYRLKFSIKQNFDSLKNQVSIFLEPKYYFNLTKREKKDKNIENNAGNYISLRANISLLNNLENGEIYFHNLTPTYGLRRNITSHINLELSFGCGISYSNSVIILDAMPSFRVGYVF